MVTVFFGLGSNLGVREDNIRKAISLLGRSVAVQQVSSLYETDPVGYLDQHSFVNAVCSAATDLTPAELLDLAKSIEQLMGRQPSFRNGPRLIDIDILSYGNSVVDTDALTIPHPRLAERSFVLAPLAEIAPDWRHPVLGRTALELADTAGREGVRLLPPDRRNFLAPHAGHALGRLSGHGR